MVVFQRSPRAEGPSHVTTCLAARHAIAGHAIAGHAILRRAIVVGLALGVALVDGSASAHGQGKLEARYSVTFGGGPFRHGHRTSDVHDDQSTLCVGISP